MTTEIGSPNYGNTRIAFCDEKYKINFNEWNDKYGIWFGWRINNFWIYFFLFLPVAKFMFSVEPSYWYI